MSGLVAVLALSLTAACHPREPGSPDAGLAKPVDPPTNPDVGNAPGRPELQGLYHLWLGSSVGDACHGPAPFFDFDSSTPDSSDQPTMQTLSSCMISGPLKGRSIKLIGHTDPRGTAEYNDKLGLERAERVKRYLVRHGVEPTRIAVDTAGKDTASNSPKDWPTDRRVQIELLQ